MPPEGQEPMIQGFFNDCKLLVQGETAQPFHPEMACSDGNKVFAFRRYGTGQTWPTLQKILQDPPAAAVQAAHARDQIANAVRIDD